MHFPCFAYLVLFCFHCSTIFGMSVRFFGVFLFKEITNVFRVGLLILTHWLGLHANMCRSWSFSFLVVCRMYVFGGWVPAEEKNAVGAEWTCTNSMSVLNLGMYLTPQNYMNWHYLSVKNCFYFYFVMKLYMGCHFSGMFDDLLYNYFIISDLALRHNDVAWSEPWEPTTAAVRHSHGGGRERGGSYLLAKSSHWSLRCSHRHAPVHLEWTGRL